MSDEISAETPPDKEQRRRVIEDVLLAFRPEVARNFGDLVGRPVPTREQALADLWAADVPRVLKHRACIDGFRRMRDDDQPALREPVEQVLRSTVAQDREISAPRLDEMIRHLAEVTTTGATEGAPLQQRHWDQWVGTTKDVYDFTTPEKTFQACNDNQRVLKFTPNRQLVESRLIVAEFWTDLPPSAFVEYVDPRNWPRYSSSWQAMTPLRELQTKENPPKGYDCDFEETVKIFNEVLTVPLQMAFRILPDQSRVWTRFNISHSHYTSSVPVDVDTGTVSAESMPGGAGRTRVQATKYLHWSDPNRPDFTRLACDFGWSELMVKMAYAPLDGVDLSSVTPGQTGTTAQASIDDAVKQFVDDVMMEWKNGIDDYTPRLENLIRRFTGPTWNLRWINDLLDLARVPVERSGDVASHVRRLADSLRIADGRKDDDG
jgi:hypothetical protein